MIREHANPHEAVAIGNNLMREDVRVPVNDIEELNKGQEGNWLNHKILMKMVDFVGLIKSQGK